MAEKLADVEKRLRAEPVYTGDPVMRQELVKEHMAYSLWRIAEALEKANVLEVRRQEAEKNATNAAAAKEAATAKAKGNR